MKLFQSTCREAGVINWVQFLEGPPQKFRRAKNRPKFERFLTTFDFDREYPGTDPHIENRKHSLSTTTPPTLGEKKVGVLWSINEKRIEVNVYRP